MNDTTDTSAEAVERLIAGATSEPWEVDAAATLRALLAERDEARAYLSRLLQSMPSTVEPLPDLHGVCTQIDNALVGLLAERDEARAYAAAERQRGDPHLAAWARRQHSTQGDGT